MTIDAAEIARLREIAEKATPGPWKAFETKLHGFDVSVISPNGDAELGNWLIAGVRWSENAAYIAAFDPPAVIALLDELEKARERIEGMRQANAGMAAERDAAHAMLRECAEYLWGTRAPMRFRIAKFLGDA